MTYNIRHAQGLDGLILPRRIAAVIQKARADVVGLQEVWHLPARHMQTTMIATPLGMASEFSAADSRGPLLMGNSVLTAGAIVSCDVIRLPHRREGRICMLTQLEVDGVSIRFASTHLALHRQTRLEALEFLAEKLPRDLPLVLVGDFNAAAVELAPLVAAGLTVPDSPPAGFPSIMPRSTLDHIAYSEHWQLENLATVRSLASDHLPLVAELSLR